MIDAFCSECGHLFVTGWEAAQHSIGRHNYRAWTEEDGRQIAAKRKREADPWALLPDSQGDPA